MVLLVQILGRDWRSIPSGSRQYLTCQMSQVGSAPLRAECSCISGWGGTGCNQPITNLVPGVTQLVSGVPAGEWRYFAISLPNETPGLVAEVRRTRGDPILFLKGASEGEEVSSMPR